MKIFHVIFSMQVGGAETMLVDILNEQVKTSNTVGLIIINDSYNSELLKKISPKVRIIMMGRKKGYNSLWVGAKINLFLLWERPDVLHFHDHTGVNYIFNKKRYNTILTLHNVGFPSENWHKYTSIIAISKTVKKEIFDITGIKAELIYNGINLPTIRRKETATRNFKVVQVGRLVIEKNGQDILLRAFAILEKKYADISFSLDFIGGGASLPYLKELSKELGLKKVAFLGSKDRSYIYNELANYDLLVQPSRYEGFGLVIAEALAANIQVVVSDIGAPMEVINEGQYGFPFKVGDPEDCAKQLEHVLIEGKSKDMQKVNEYLSMNFDIQKTAERYVSLYEKIVKK